MIVFAYYLSVFIHRNVFHRRNHKCLLFIKKLIVSDLYFFGHSVNNITTDGFTNGKNMSNKKKLPVSLCR
jgi:hypothetical protein